MKIRVLLMNITTQKTFYKYFKTEYDRDKFIRRLKYSKKLIVVDDCKDERGYVE